MFFYALSFSSIDFPQINSTTFLLIPISPECSLPHQHEQIKNKTLLLNVFYGPSNKKLNLIIKCIIPQKVLFLYLFVQNSDFSNPKNKNKKVGKV